MFSLGDSYPSPKRFGPCECTEGDTYAKLRQLLEGMHLVDWYFQYFDVESRCMINCKLEGSIDFLWMYMSYVPLAKPNLESKKCMCVVDLDFDFDSQQTLEC